MAGVLDLTAQFVQDFHALETQRDALARERDVLARERDAPAGAPSPSTPYQGALTAEIETLRAENTRLVALAAQHRVAQEETAALRAERDVLARRVRQLQEAPPAAPVLHQRTELEAKIERLTAELDTARAALRQRASSGADVLREERDALREERNALREERDCLARTNVACRLELEEADATLKRLSNENQNLRKELARGTNIR